jgi:hypothetical protein
LERYPEHPGLADSVGLAINWDAYCFPIKEGLICVWMGDWTGGYPPSVTMTAMKTIAFNDGLFYGIRNDIQGAFQDACRYYTEDEMALAIEGVRQREPIDDVVSSRDLYIFD